MVIAWTDLKVFTIGQQAIHWPGLHNAVSITLYGGKPYAAVWVFQPLGRDGDPGRLPDHRAGHAPARGEFFGCVGKTLYQVWRAVSR